MQCILIFFPVLISFLYPVQKIFYSFLTIFPTNIDAGRLETSLKSISNNEKTISIICGLIFSLLIYIWRSKVNKEKIFNVGNQYGDFPFFIYKIAAKFLGYGSVSLVRVPIYLQFKLILKDTFRIL